MWINNIGLIEIMYKNNIVKTFENTPIFFDEHQILIGKQGIIIPMSNIIMVDRHVDCDLVDVEIFVKDWVSNTFGGD